MDIKGKVFIVTGGASGLGEGTARMLAASGGTVVIADMQAEKGEADCQRNQWRVCQMRCHIRSRRPSRGCQSGVYGQADGFGQLRGYCHWRKNRGQKRRAQF